VNNDVYCLFTVLLNKAAIWMSYLQSMTVEIKEFSTAS